MYFQIIKIATLLVLLDTMRKIGGFEFLCKNPKARRETKNKIEMKSQGPKKKNYYSVENKEEVVPVMRLNQFMNLINKNCRL